MEFYQKDLEQVGASERYIGQTLKASYAGENMLAIFKWSRQVYLLVNKRSRTENCGRRSEGEGREKKGRERGGP